MYIDYFNDLLKQVFAFWDYFFSYISNDISVYLLDEPLFSWFVAIMTCSLVLFLVRRLLNLFEVKL